MKTPPSCAACANSFCAKLLPDSREAICRAKIWVNYSRKNRQAFFLENKQIVILETGCIIALRMGGGARQQSVDLLGQGDLMGISNLFCGQSDREYFQILPLTECAGCMLPVSLLEKLILEHSDICATIIAQFSNRFSRVVDNMMSKTTYSAEERIAYAESLLLKRGVTRYSHEDLAFLSGLNRVTISKTISQRKGEPQKAAPNGQRERPHFRKT